MGHQRKKNKTERAAGLGRRTKEETVKWNQMTALRFQTGGKTSDILSLPSGHTEWSPEVGYTCPNEGGQQIPGHCPVMLTGQMAVSIDSQEWSVAATSWR